MDKGPWNAKRRRHGISIFFLDWSTLVRGVLIEGMWHESSSCNVTTACSRLDGPCFHLESYRSLQFVSVSSCNQGNSFTRMATFYELEASSKLFAAWVEIGEGCDLVVHSVRGNLCSEAISRGLAKATLTFPLICTSVSASMAYHNNLHVRRPSAELFP